MYVKRVKSKPTRAYTDIHTDIYSSSPVLDDDPRCDAIHLEFMCRALVPAIAK